MLNLNEVQKSMNFPFADIKLDDNITAFVTKDQVEFIDNENSEPIEFQDQYELDSFIKLYKLNVEGVHIRNKITY